RVQSPRLQFSTDRKARHWSDAEPYQPAKRWTGDSPPVAVRFRVTKPKGDGPLSEEWSKKAKVVLTP
ncbi:MAG TPA: hypothetical protein VHV77_11395, partial [Pirellulales bacterium]|nr:hypothetical protein [Pirellulales bacterium]